MVLGILLNDHGVSFYLQKLMLLDILEVYGRDVTVGWLTVDGRVIAKKHL